MWKKLLKYLKYFYIKMIRSNHSPRSIAFAIALGFFVACFIPIGFHTIVIIFLAFVFRVDKILSFAATWIVNPYTVPFFYPVFCSLGSMVIGKQLSLTHVNKNLLHVLKNGEMSLKSFEVLSGDFLICLLIGGFISGIVVGAVGYYATYVMVKKHRKARLTIKRNKRKLYKKKILSGKEK